MKKINNCSDLLHSISSYIDGDLSPDDCQLLKKHMADCENCRIVVNTMKKTVEIYQILSKGDKAPDDVKERLFLLLNLEQPNPSAD
jgi:anti-sigma factor (TIGR02949 family)